MLLFSSLMDSMGILYSLMSSGLDLSVANSEMHPYVGFFLFLSFSSCLPLVPLEMASPNKQLAVELLSQALLLGWMPPVFYNVIVS